MGGTDRGGQTEGEGGRGGQLSLFLCRKQCSGVFVIQTLRCRVKQCVSLKLPPDRVCVTGQCRLFAFNTAPPAG